MDHDVSESVNYMPACLVAIVTRPFAESFPLSLIAVDETDQEGTTSRTMRGSTFAIWHGVPRSYTLDSISSCADTLMHDLQVTSLSLKMHLLLVSRKQKLWSWLL